MDRHTDYRTEELSFDSAGVACAATLYRPTSTDTAVPCVIIAGDVSQTQRDGLPAFARRFAAAGFAALTFDYRYLGLSAGEPRQLIDYQQQRADLRAAIEFSRTLEDIDPERIALWGFSFGGGHVIDVAAHDHQLAAVVVLCPLLDGLKFAIASGVLNPLRFAAASARAAWIREPVWMPVIGAKRQLAFFSQPEAAFGFETLPAEDSLWRNEVLTKPTQPITAIRPIRHARNIQCPLWAGLGTRDTVVPLMPIRRLAERAPLGELHIYHGGHFEGFFDHFDDVVGEQLEFLNRSLGTA